MIQRKNDTKNNSARRKALLAIAFAGGMLNSQPPALSETEGTTESTDSIIQKIANDEHMQSDLRAFHLLRLASELTSGYKRTVVDEHFTPVLNEKTRQWTVRNSKQLLSVITSWADRVSSDERTSNFEFNAKTKSKSGSPPIADENNVLANTAIQLSLAQLDKASDKVAKLNLYFIASNLYQKLGNSSGMRQCNKVLDAAFNACLSTSPADQEQITAATSVLNSMAYGWIPINVPDYPKGLHLHMQAKPFTEKEFRASETLKIKAVAMADRLAANNHLRRKAHRDLVLWYMQLGKIGKGGERKTGVIRIGRLQGRQYSISATRGLR